VGKMHGLMTLHQVVDIHYLPVSFTRLTMLFRGHELSRHDTS